jgi:hypothetical protein
VIDRADDRGTEVHPNAIARPEEVQNADQ